MNKQESCGRISTAPEIVVKSLPPHPWKGSLQVHRDKMRDGTVVTRPSHWWQNASSTTQGLLPTGVEAEQVNLGAPWCCLWLEIQGSWNPFHQSHLWEPWHLSHCDQKEPKQEEGAHPLSGSNAHGLPRNAIIKAGVTLKNKTKTSAQSCNHQHPTENQRLMRWRLLSHSQEEASPNQPGGSVGCVTAGSSPHPK